jgi:hypothetical protein
MHDDHHDPVRWTATSFMHHFHDALHRWRCKDYVLP